MESRGEMIAGQNTVYSLTAPGALAATRTPTEAHNVPLILLSVFAVIFILDWAQTVFLTGSLLGMEGCTVMREQSTVGQAVDNTAITTH